MSLASVAKKLIAVADKLSKSFQDDVSHVTWTGQDGMGAPTTVTVIRKALVEQKLQQVKLDDGRFVTVHTKLSFLTPITANGAANRIEPVDPKDKFILSDGSSGATYTADSGLRNPEAAAPFINVVYLG